MHRALRVVELLDTILRSVEFESRHATAAALASTCRAFCEPANDVLWEELWNATPLLKCLPPDRTELRRSGLSSEAAREEGISQWNRFLTHAARVKLLLLRYDRYVPYHCDWFETMVFMRGDATSRTLFPKLHTLHVTCYTTERELTNNLFLFLSPAIRTVQLKTTVVTGCKILALLQDGSCPQLQSLVVKNVAQTSSFYDGETLEELRFGGSDESPFGVEAISRLHALKHLHIEELHHYMGPYHLSENIFSSLETLELDGLVGSRSLMQILEAINPVRLHTLSIGDTRSEDIEEYDRDERIKCILTLLSEKFAHIRSLRFDLQCDLGLHFPDALFKLYSLEELYFGQNVYAFQLTIKDIKALGKAYPNLRRLQVYSADKDEVAPFWTLDALAWLAEHLPRLEYVDTMLDTSSAASLSAPCASSSVPIVLMVGNSPLARSVWRQTAAYISKVYPNATCKGRAPYQDELDDDASSSDSYSDCPGDKKQLLWAKVGRAVAEARKAGDASLSQTQSE